LWIETDPKSLEIAVRNIHKMDLAEMGRCGTEWMKAEFSWYHISMLMLQTDKEAVVGN
jgi:hypothetical protein